MAKLWVLPQGEAETGQLLGETLGLSRTVGNILVQRGLTSVTDALDFLKPSAFNLHSPFAFSQMSKAVERLSSARVRGEKVLIYGDYDVDGVTSAALLYKVIMDLGFRAVIYIPHRQDEGYGLHREVVDRAARAEVRVIVTVDCGITANPEVAAAGEKGIDVIITDHHEPPEVLPQALAIINPKIPGETYPCRDLAGVGVAYKLAQALLQDLGGGESGIAKERDFLDLVALGTIADVVPLRGENRVLVALGLSQMEETVHAGLEALLRECGLWGKSLKAGQIAFMVAPRINAAGRMDSAKAGLELLLTGDSGRAQDLARSLSKENQERQEIERGILAEAVAMVESGPLPRVIVLSAPGWHPGVIGIVASRLVERYYRPVFLIAEDGDMSKGSARGIAGFHVLEQLTGQKDLLTKFGGHRLAAGFSLPTVNISRLQTGLNKQAGYLPEDVFREVLQLDGLVELEEVNADMLAELEWLAPFGAGNPGPVLAARGVIVDDVRVIGKDSEHLKFRFGPGGAWEGIAFRQGERVTELAIAERLDIAFSAEWNVFGDQRRIQLVLREFQRQADWDSGPQTVEEGTEPAAAGVEPVASGSAEGRSVLTESAVALREVGSALKEAAATGLDSPVVPTSKEQAPSAMVSTGDHRHRTVSPRASNLEFGREWFVEAYRRLRSKPVESGKFVLTPEEATREKIALQVFEELVILRWQGGTKAMAWQWLPIQRKLNLEASLRYTYFGRRWHQNGLDIGKRTGLNGF